MQRSVKLSVRCRPDFRNVPAPRWSLHVTLVLSSFLDLMVEFVVTHMMKDFPFDLYLWAHHCPASFNILSSHSFLIIYCCSLLRRCVQIIHKLLCYQKKCRIRLHYTWRELWSGSSLYARIKAKTLGRSPDVWFSSVLTSSIKTGPAVVSSLRKIWWFVFLKQTESFPFRRDWRMILVILEVLPLACRQSPSIPSILSTSHSHKTGAWRIHRSWFDWMEPGSTFHAWMLDFLLNVLLGRPPLTAVMFVSVQLSSTCWSSWCRTRRRSCPSTTSSTWLYWWETLLPVWTAAWSSSGPLQDQGFRSLQMDSGAVHFSVNAAVC